MKIVKNISLIFFRNHKSLAERIHYAGRGKTRLQEASLRILHKDECERLGAYKNDKNNKTVKVRSDVELCAARVSSRRLPESWIKVQSSSKGNGGNDGKTSYKRGSDDGTPSPKTFFYGGIIRFNMFNLSLRIIPAFPFLLLYIQNFHYLSWRLMQRR